MADPQLPDIRLDPAHLYREESFTDGRAGMLRKLTPVDTQGRDDTSRPVIYEGHASLMTPGGQLPLQFHIDASTMAEAIEKFPAAARQALEHTLEELQRLQRESQSQIVVPGAGGPGPVPGGGRIKF